MEMMIAKGALLGLTLSFMIGPLLFAIVQAGIEHGFRAGMAVASGIWVSDLLFVILIYHGVGAIETVIALPHFRLWAGLAGGIVLTGFGIGSLLAGKTIQPDKQTVGDKVLDVLDGPEPEGVDHNWKRWGYLGWWSKGFLMNTINPFTVFFWLGISTAVIIPNSWNTGEMFRFFGGMMAMLVFMDTLKAYGAKWVRGFLTPGHVLWVRRAIGLSLILFGIGLVVRVGIAPG